MRPVEFTGTRIAPSVAPYVLGGVAILGFLAGVALSSPGLALVWAVVWGTLALVNRRGRRRDAPFFKARLDDVGMEIQTRKGCHAMRWTEVDSIEWTATGNEGADLVFRFRQQKYVYDGLLSDVDFADFIQALKLKLPDKTANLATRR